MARAAAILCASAALLGAQQQQAVPSAAATAATLTIKSATLADTRTVYVATPAGYALEEGIARAEDCGEPSLSEEVAELELLSERRLEPGAQRVDVDGHRWSSGRSGTV